MRSQRGKKFRQSSLSKALRLWQAKGMSLANQYRTSLEYKEILRILQKASTSTENFFWQTNEAGRHVVKIHQFEIDFVAREVVLYFDQAKVFENIPLFLKIDYRDTVFKVQEFSVGQNTVSFPVPKEVKTLELRSKPRFSFNKPNKFMGIKPSLANQENGHELLVKVADISQDGMGILISENNRQFLKNNRIIWITKLQEEELPYPVLAEVVYINSEVDQSFDKRKQRELRVGLKLSAMIPLAAIESFIQ